MSGDRWQSWVKASILLACFAMVLVETSCGTGFKPAPRRPARAADVLAAISACQGFGDNPDEWLSKAKKDGWRVGPSRSIDFGTTTYLQSEFGGMTVSRQELSKGLVGKLGRCEVNFTSTNTQVAAQMAELVDKNYKPVAGKPPARYLSPHESLYFSISQPRKGMVYAGFSVEYKNYTSASRSLKAVQ